MSKARKIITCLIPVLLLTAFAAYAVFSPRAGLATAIGAAVYLIVFTCAAIACVKGFLNFFKGPDGLPPSALLGERSRKRLHPAGKIIFYSLIAQLLFIIASYILNNLINGFQQTVFEWYADAFVSGAGGVSTDAIAGAEKFAVFPFIPAFTDFISEVTGVNRALPAFILNTLAVAGLCVVLYEFMLLDYDKKTASAAVVLLLVSPAAVYMMMPLSGNTFFMLFVLLAFLLHRKGRMFFGGLFAALAAMVNVFGLLLFIPLLIGGIRNCICAGSTETENGKKKTSKTTAEAVLSLVPMLLLLVFVLLAYFGCIRVSLPFESIYPQGFRFFFEAFNEPALSLANREFTLSVFYCILPLLGFGILICVCIDKVHTLYALACMLLLAFAPTLFGTEMFPYAAALLPVLPVLLPAKLKNRKARVIAALIVFASQIIFISAVFLKGRI